MKVVFMGTPEFAVTILDRIIKSGHDVVGVVTTPDKPAGRGQHLKCSDVKNYAVAHQLPLFQPVKMKDETFVSQLLELQADVFVVVAFRMLPHCVYSIPPKGTFNVHASLLPQYRGAAPIQWAIINGEKTSGVTTFLLDEHTDTGAIIRQQAVDIMPTDNAGQLHDKLMYAGAQIAIDTLKDLEQGTAKPIAQIQDAILKPAPKIFKEDMLIHWDDTAENIYNKIRGLSPYPTAFSRIRYIDNNGEKDISLKIYEVSVEKRENVYKPGNFRIINDKKMLVSTKTDDISLQIIQFEGKKRMGITDFLKGFRKENYTDFLF